MSEPPKSFLAAFDTEVVAFLQPLLDRAYQLVSGQHDPSVGFNGTTFGVSLYNVVVFQIAAAVREQAPTRIKVISERPSFRLRIDDRWDVAVHRVGNTAADDIQCCFPSSDSDAVAGMVTQPMLPGLGIEAPSFEHATRAVVGHLGNPTDGLCAFYACIPSREDAGKIVEWGVTHELLVRRHTDSAGDGPVPTGTTESSVPAPASPTVATVADEKVDDFDLRLKPNVKRDDRTE